MWFFLLPPLMILEYGEKLLMRFFGYENWYLQSLATFRHNWKIMMGKKVVAQEHVVERGYLYTMANYSDGDKLYFR